MIRLAYCRNFRFANSDSCDVTVNAEEMFRRIEFATIEQITQRIDAVDNNISRGLE